MPSWRGEIELEDQNQGRQGINNWNDDPLCGSINGIKKALNCQSIFLGLLS
jgi:hypothetical protein